MNERVKNRRDNRGHAVVIGGSMAGLVTARVLADHFDRVTVLERDVYPDGPLARKGVPQARHAHGLLAQGQVALETLFPGLTDQVASAGAPILDGAADVAWHSAAGWGHRFRSGITLLSSTRNLLEWVVRRRVAAVPGVSFRQGGDVTGLLADRDGVAGVSFRPRGAGEPAERIEADLVVDASGRGSRTPEWLKALGFEAPAETVVDARLGYASRLYRQPVGFPVDWKALYLQGHPLSGGRGGLIQPVEDGRWMVTLSARGGDYPPTDENGFRAFARSLSIPLVYEAITAAEPLSPISGFRATANRRRHYEWLSRLPERLVVLGDAACAFNPVYGQGMSTAALGALALGECLARQRSGSLLGLARRFQKRLAEVNAVPWKLATAEDLRTAGGPRPGLLARLLQGYVEQVICLGTHDAAARKAFLEVVHLLKRPSALFRPGLVLRVLGQAILPTRGRQAGLPAASCAAGVRG